METNSDIRERIRKSRVFFWEIAAHLKWSDAKLTRKLRKTLNAEERAQILNAVDAIALKN